jgi:CRP-like cAMP-binding protein
MTGFIKFCNQLAPLNEVAEEDLLNALKTKTVPKGEHLLKTGEVCRYLYFIDEGLTKIYFNKEDKEFIMRFFPENTMFTVLDTYLTQSPSDYQVVALEPTTVTYISRNDMEALCIKHHCMETFLRTLISFASLNMMKRVSEMLEENATERYNHFVRENGHLMQRISLGDLANYLGITQVSLSRIRAKK